VYGRGATFRVEIPKEPGDASLIENDSNSEIKICAPDAKILVVDDNTVNLNVVCGLLQLCQIVAETAISGKQAIELVLRNHYDIVFMDHRMPEMTGIETTMAIRELGINVTIIALTASAIVGARELMLEAGMDDYLSKPIIKKELMNMLKKWIPVEKLVNTQSIVFTSDGAINEGERMLWSKIEQIEWISVAKGLERVDGQLDVYKKTLQLMIAEADKCIINLGKFQLSGDMDSFRTEIHGIKGSLANIGAIELSVKAYDLEMASKRKDSESCVVKLPIFLDGLSKLSKELAEAFAIGGALELPHGIAQMLEILTIAFKELDLPLIEKEIEKLQMLSVKGAAKEKIEHIIDLANIMEYEGATLSSNELLNNN
jgi:CheY-like chemotaxis protein/HPt (histidine-containing phosphotransfer) domain-containing protein